jgi:Fe2+ or Zn2+ uptake regulation protein
LKLFLILITLALFGAFIYWRLRPYIATARRVLGFMRDLRRVNTTSSTNESVRRSTTENEKLVRCQSCETWIPATRAVTLSRSRQAASSYYCSHACLERAAEANQPARPRQREQR